jgi:hypothetical protein
MRENNIRESFLRKIEENYQTYLSKWMAINAASLIEKAEKIAVIKQTYQQLQDEYGSFYSDCLAYLIQFENPLEIISDDVSVLAEDTIVTHDDVSYSLFHLYDHRNADNDYELDMSAAQPDRDDDEMEV